VAKKVAGQWLITNNTNMAVKVVVLEDGSRISLQPNSQLKYPVQFGPGQREVVLQGGAFFEIARNEQKPFLVQTAHLTIKVLGTSFAVSAYQESARAEEVSVKTGKVSVITKPEQGQPATSARQMELTPNQRAVFDQTKHELVKGLVAIPLPVVKLEKSRFIFDNVALGNVFALIEEVYQVKIVLEDKSVAQCPLTAALTEESLYVKLDLICKSIGASYEVRDTQILIKGTGCNEN
jgi:ferric-dicitrate binding protein FerR (iron transport regulator)